MPSLFSVSLLGSSLLLLSVSCTGGGADDSDLSFDASTAEPDGEPGSSSDARATDAGASMNGGALSGNITRSATPAAGGVGHLYIAVFTEDPVTAQDSATLVGNARVDNVDMSTDGVSIAYTLTDVPPRAEPYFVTAFLDDNGTVMTEDPASAGPDRGDLVSIDGFASHQITVSSDTTVDLDLDLNFNLPF